MVIVYFSFSRINSECTAVILMCVMCQMLCRHTEHIQHHHTTRCVYVKHALCV